MDDVETNKIMNEGKLVAGFVESSVWQLIRKDLTAKIEDVGSVFGLDNMSPDKLVVEVGARQLAVQMVKEWIAEVEGKAEQYNVNVQMLQKEDSTPTVRNR